MTLTFRNVPDKGFASFGYTLTKGQWALIPTPKPSEVLADCSVLSMLKGRLSMTVAAVLGAMGQSSKVVEADREWDRTQIRLDSQVRLDEHDSSADRRAMARRVRIAMLEGEGTAQINLRAEAALDYGRTQVARCDDQQSPLYADIKALGYRPFVEDIRKANDGLALALGRDTPEARQPAPSVLLREAVGAAATAFHAVTNNLDYLLEQTPAGTPSHTQLIELRGTLQKLLENYASSAPAPEEDTTEDPATPPAPLAPNLGGIPFTE